MALRPDIGLQARAPDISNLFGNALINVQRIRDLKEGKEQQPLRNRLLEANVGQAEQQQQQTEQENRIRSIATGALELLPTIKLGNPDAVRAQLLQRKTQLIEEGKPTNDTDEALALLDQSGGLDQLRQLTEGAIEVGQQIGVLERGRTAGQREFADLTAGLSPAEQGQARKIKLGLSPRAVGAAARTTDIGGVPHIFDPVSRTMVPVQVDETGVVTAETVAETERIIAGGKARGKGEAEIPIEERKLTLTQNVARIGDLTKDAKSRASSVRKAGQFLRALKTGGAESGASRTGLGFIPGVFTDQAEFDEKFNAFAEVAARAKLKAAGEIRPTDADVEGMKRAIFGIGRDEPTNVQLLEEFIADQRDLDDELNALIDAKTAKQLDIFVPSPAAVDVNGLSDDALFDF